MERRQEENTRNIMAIVHEHEAMIAQVLERHEKMVKNARARTICNMRKAGFDLHTISERLRRGHFDHHFHFSVGISCPALSTKEVVSLGWEIFRNAVRARSIVVFWLGEAMRTSCAVGGAGRRADAAAYAAEFASLRLVRV